MTNIVDDLVRGSHQAAETELRHMLEHVQYSDMTACEVVAFLTLLRPVFDRTFAESAPAAPALQLIPGGGNRPA